MSRTGRSTKPAGIARKDSGTEAVSRIATSESFWPPPHTLPAGGVDGRPRPASRAGIPPCVRFAADCTLTRDRPAQPFAAVPATRIVAHESYQERRPAGLVAITLCLLTHWP